MTIKPTEYRINPTTTNHIKLILKNTTMEPKINNIKNSTKQPPKNGENIALKNKKNSKTLTNSI